MVMVYIVMAFLVCEVHTDVKRAALCTGIARRRVPTDVSGAAKEIVRTRPHACAPVQCCWCTGLFDGVSDGVIDGVFDGSVR